MDRPRRDKQRNFEKENAALGMVVRNYEGGKETQNHAVARKKQTQILLTTKPGNDLFKKEAEHFVANCEAALAEARCDADMEDDDEHYATTYAAWLAYAKNNDRFACTGGRAAEGNAVNALIPRAVGEWLIDRAENPTAANAWLDKLDARNLAVKDSQSAAVVQAGAG